MVSRKQKAFYVALAAGLVWLRYAKSAEGARRRLKEAGDTLNHALKTVQERTEQIDAVVHDVIVAAKEQKTRAERVLNDTLTKLDTAATVVHDNLTHSSHEISTMVRDIRTAVEHSIQNPSEAA